MLWYIIGLVGTFILTVLIGYFLIKKLRQMNLAQTIRNDGPQSHLKKVGTPSMGGLMFLIPMAIASFFFMPQALLPLIGLVLYGGLGFYDDLEKRASKKKGGLSIGKKFLLQVAAGIIIGVAGLLLVGGETALGFTKSVSVPVHPVVYVIFITIFLLAVTNSVNFTDGLDGLCTCVSFPVFIALGGIALVAGQTMIAMYCGIIIVALLGFLLFNRHPAKIFMGDTGSMALGAIIACVCIALRMEILLLLLGLIYMLETISVILQVGYFKATGGKRLFKMAPLHHHLELSGFKETKVVLIFTLASIIVSALSFILYWSI